MTVIRKMYDKYPRTGIKFDPKEGRTKQSFAEEANINSIMAKWERTGQMEHLSKGTPEYGDFSNVSDYQSAQASIIAADDAFLRIPAEIRRKMENDPQVFLAFMADPANHDEAREMGLLTPEPEPDPPEPNPPTPPAPEPAAE